VIKEKIYLDKADANTLYDDITVTDNALTRPWSAISRGGSLRCRLKRGHDRGLFQGYLRREISRTSAGATLNINFAVG
jgi:hypothetical protein